MAIYVVAAESGLQKQFSSLLPPKERKKERKKALSENQGLFDRQPPPVGGETTINSGKNQRERGKAWSTLGLGVRLCLLMCVIVNSVHKQ